MRTYYTSWYVSPADSDEVTGSGWYCATVYSDGNGESMGKGWEQSDYAGPFETAAEALESQTVNPNGEIQA